MEASKLEKLTTKKFGEILMTYDYDQFKFITSNRRINKKNYNQLERSMKKEQLIIPICVNQSMQVIDGQHRLLICKNLGLPLYFYIIKGYSTSQMKTANLVSSNWSKDDFLHAYFEEGQADYIAFFNIKTKYCIGTSDLIKVFAKFKGNKSSSALSVEFEEGQFKIYEEREKVEEFLQALSEFKFFKSYMKSKFVCAFLELYTHPAYKNDIMLAKLEERQHQLQYQLTKDDYLLVLANKIYSYGNSKDTIFYNKDTRSFH